MDSMMDTPVSQQPIGISRRVPFDLVFVGVLMILAGFSDLYIIFANPNYSLPIFGIKLSGAPGWAFKLIHPVIHFSLGYGATLGRWWAYLLFMLYSLYGLVNATANRLLLEGPHRIRTVFIIGTLLLMGYLYRRRDRFRT